jgi:[ribosomal protein S18]-alanine N-acetyltransferase
MQLREYEWHDFNAIYKLDQSCFPPGIAYSKTTLRYFLSLATGQSLLAVENNEIAGFILSEVNGSLAHIITLDVGKAYRRSGVGSKLLSAMEDAVAAQGVRTVLLETAVNNEAAVAFWQRHGYSVEGVLKRYYLSHIDAYEMRKLLAVKDK